MSVRRLTTRSLALAAAVAVVAVPLAAQQDTTKLRRTTSDRRIAVSKGEVEMPQRVDTVFLTRSDTVQVQVVRVDTVTVATPAPIIPAKVLNAWYWGLFAGGTGPTGKIDRIQTNGYHAGGVLGFENRTSWIGGRLLGAYNQIGREQGLPVALVGSGLPQMWQFAADLKLKGYFGGWSLYGVGGLGFNSYTRMATVSNRPDLNNLQVNPLITFPDLNNLPTVNSLDDITVCDAATVINGQDNDCFRLATNQWRTDFSWNFGVGTDFHIGRQDMFLEVRWNPVSTHGTYTWYLPISLGLRYF